MQRDKRTKIGVYDCEPQTRKYQVDQNAAYLHKYRHQYIFHTEHKDVPSHSGQPVPLARYLLSRQQDAPWVRLFAVHQAVKT